MMNDSKVKAIPVMKEAAFEWTLKGITLYLGIMTYQGICKIVLSNFLNPLYEGDSF